MPVAPAPLTWMTLPTSPDVKPAVAEVSVAEPLVIAPSVTTLPLPTAP
jgi:hypothetical protein